MLMALLRAYYAQKITLKQAKGILRQMENFHVQFTAVTAQRTGGGTARMYAASAQDLYGATDKNACAKVLKEFVRKMRDRIPGYDEFEANYREIGFLSDNTRQKPLVQYLLERTDAHFRTTSAPDYTTMSIDHIAPEHPVDGSTVSEDHVGMIGNLILLPDELNNKLANKSLFKAKKQAYEHAGVPMDPVLRDSNSWTDKQVEKRTKFLARSSYETIFKV